MYVKRCSGESEYLGEVERDDHSQGNLPYDCDHSPVVHAVLFRRVADKLQFYVGGFIRSFWTDANYGCPSSLTFVAAATT